MKYTGDLPLRDVPTTSHKRALKPSLHHTPSSRCLNSRYAKVFAFFLQKRRLYKKDLSWLNLRTGEQLWCHARARIDSVQPHRQAAAVRVGDRHLLQHQWTCGEIELQAALPRGVGFF